MPLLQSIVGQLDRELARLHALRELVAELGKTPLVAVQISASPVVVSEPSESVLAEILPSVEPAKRERKQRTDAGKPRGRRAAKPSPASESRALAQVVPSGPVVFTATQLAEEKARRDQARESQSTIAPEATREDLDALSRNLSARWSAGLAQ